MGFTVKQARQYAGFTQREMAEKLGIPHNIYRKIEQSPEDATVATAKKISEVVGIPIDPIFFSPEYLFKVDTNSRKGETEYEKILPEAPPPVRGSGART